MPTENVNKADNLIDVGEADQVSTEINLDNKGEPEKVEAPKEEKIEVEEVSETPEDKTFENERETKLQKKTRFKNIAKVFKNVSLNLLVKCEKRKGKKKKPLLTQMQ